MDGDERPLALRGEKRDAAQLLGRDDEGLLAEDVEAPRQGGAAERGVRGGRRADVDEVEILALDREEVLDRVDGIAVELGDDISRL